MCMSLRFTTWAEHVAAQSAAKNKASVTNLLETVLKAENRLPVRAHPPNAGEARRRPAVKAFDFAVGAPEALITELARLALFRRTENVALLGPSGVGTRSSGDRPWVSRRPPANIVK